MNNPEQQDFIKTFLKISLHRMNDLYLGKLETSLMTLTKYQLWQPFDVSNHTIGGIVAHLCEHIRTSQLSLSRQDGSFRDDYVVYFPNENTEPSEIISKFKMQIDSWKQTMSSYIEGVGKLDIEDVHDLYNLVEHTSYHLGQIIDRSQNITGKPFNFYHNGLNEKFLRDKIEKR